MTEPLFLSDAYLRQASGTVVASEDGAVTLDRGLFYATGGGQPGDSGVLEWDGAHFTVTEAVKGAAGAIRLTGHGDVPELGTDVRQVLDWGPRWGHMRIHTALHLLSVVIPLPVSGGQIAEAKGRLDFDMPDAPGDKQALQDALNDLVERDLPVTTDWIDDARLDANPGLVKTMSVQPPRGAGRVRLVRIGQGDAQVDLQPCGGTHVARTREIGRLRIGKIEKKGARNRRVYVHLDDA